MVSFSSSSISSTSATLLLLISLLLTTLVSASPLLTPRHPQPQPQEASSSSSTESASVPVSVTFIGAADGQYSLTIPPNSVFTPTDNALSISHITTSGGGSCVFFGVDGAVYVSPADGGEGDVGPPQTIAGGVCGGFPGHEYGMW